MWGNGVFPSKRLWYCMKASLASGIEDLVSFVITLFRALFCLILVVHDLRFFLLVGYQVLDVLVLHLVVASVENQLIF